MKITLELPDDVIGVFFNYIRQDYEKGLTLCAQPIASDKMHDGAVIKIGDNK